MATTTRPIQSVTNIELYNRWAKVYDTDGNILQAIDDHLLPTLLIQAFTLLSSTQTSPIIITELGAGTGRNTAKLLLPIPVPGNASPEISEINALDLSSAMLEVARKRCNDILSSNASSPGPEIRFLEFDALNPTAFPKVEKLEGKANLVLSTLVLEHLPVDVFFSTIKKLLRLDGIVVLTNMHSEMGDISQAGFVDEVTGEKIRGTSFSHTIEEVIEEGRQWGFSIVGEMGEREVKEDEVGEGRLLGPRGSKWIDVRVWFGCIMRLGNGRVEA